MREHVASPYTTTYLRMYDLLVSPYTGKNRHGKTFLQVRPPPEIGFWRKRMSDESCCFFLLPFLSLLLPSNILNIYGRQPRMVNACAHRMSTCRWWRCRQEHFSRPRTSFTLREEKERMLAEERTNERTQTPPSLSLIYEARSQEDRPPKKGFVMPPA